MVRIGLQKANTYLHEKRLKKFLAKWLDGIFVVLIDLSNRFNESIKWHFRRCVIWRSDPVSFKMFFFCTKNSKYLKNFPQIYLPELQMRAWYPFSRRTPSKILQNSSQCLHLSDRIQRRQNSPSTIGKDKLI